MNVKFRRGLACVTGLLWLWALTLPAFRINDENSYGYSVLAFGWLGLTLGYVEWLMNPLLIGAVLILWAGAPTLARQATATALLLLATVSLLRHDLITDEGGASRTIQMLLPGYYAWFSSVVVAVFGLFIPSRAET